MSPNASTAVEIRTNPRLSRRIEREEELSLPATFNMIPSFLFGGIGIRL